MITKDKISEIFCICDDFLKLALMGECTGISFVDSTCIPVCHNKRIPRVSKHRVFKGRAAVGKSTMGWYFQNKRRCAVMTWVTGRRRAPAPWTLDRKVAQSIGASRTTARGRASSRSPSLLQPSGAVALNA